jgi:hypothetical protein
LFKESYQLSFKCNIKEPHKRRPRPNMGWSSIKEEEEELFRGRRGGASEKGTPMSRHLSNVLILPSQNIVTLC